MARYGNCLPVDVIRYMSYVVPATQPVAVHTTDALFPWATSTSVMSTFVPLTPNLYLSTVKSDVPVFWTVAMMVLLAAPEAPLNVTPWFSLVPYPLLRLSCKCRKPER